jgi:superfamily I DNA/RNA helicase
MIIERMIGGAGTGKTTMLIKKLNEEIAGGVPLPAIGYISFTKAALEVIKSRSSAIQTSGEYDGSEDSTPWFRTIHSVCYRCLEIDNPRMLGNTRADNEWVENAVGEPVRFSGSYQEGGSLVYTGSTDAAVALNLWGCARNTMETLADCHRRRQQSGQEMRSLTYIQEIVGRYEECKAEDGKIDFTDLLSMFAGFESDLSHGAVRVDAGGLVPDVRVWFHDECQDASKLSMEVFKRLLTGANVEKAVMAGDPFQNIYDFSGSDHRVFTGLEVGKESIMPKSFRCGVNILRYGESVLTGSPGYFKRGISPADHKGIITNVHTLQSAIEFIDPREDWLILARTNSLVRRIQSVLSKSGLAWSDIQGQGRRGKQSRRIATACLALRQLCDGRSIDGKGWRAITQSVMPCCLAEGTKSRHAKIDSVKDLPSVDVAGIGFLGANDKLLGMIKSTYWAQAFEKGEDRDMAHFVRRWGPEAVLPLRIRVGTIHSVKGGEADNVILLGTTNRIIAEASESTEGRGAEQRLAYVGITRAKKQLITVQELRKPCLPMFA